MDIIIEESDLQEIATAVGFPAIPMDVLEISGEDMKKFCVTPALREFYRAYPVTEKYSQTVTGEFSIPFPDDLTFGITDARIMNPNMTSNLRTSSPFANEMIYRSGDLQSPWGVNGDFRNYESSLVERTGIRTEISRNSASRIDVKLQGKTITGFANYQGELIIDWAKWSEDFSDVPFVQKNEVVIVAQGFLCEILANVRSQADVGQGVDFDSAVFRDKIQEAKDIRERWRNRQKVVIIRG